jgi:GNAT superfamily N-acetyltransferase
MAKLRDAETIALIHIRSLQKMYHEFIPESILKEFSLEERTAQWYELLRQEVKVLLVEVHEQPLGFASICMFRDENAELSMGEISAIYLYPDYWRRGFGTQLCLAALSELNHRGYNTVFVWVLAANDQVRGFYESLGFEATKSTQLKEFYEGGALLQEILYRKILPLALSPKGGVE